MSIPKDESLAGTPTTHGLKSVTAASGSSKRSKSVDFRLFEELKENYFSSHQHHSTTTATTTTTANISASAAAASTHRLAAAHQLVFGQSLYKCILNDLSTSSSSSSRGGRAQRSKTRGRAAQPIIASKHDLTLMNSMNENDSMLSGLLGSSLVLGQQQSPAIAANEDIYFNSKRNSVLFEALDLKHLASTAARTPSTSKLDFLSSFSTVRPKQASAMAAVSSPASQSPTNQNLSIRSEGLVPNIVRACCRHVSEHGLDVVGIFRIDISKKRIKEVKNLMF